MRQKAKFNQTEKHNCQTISRHESFSFLNFVCIRRSNSLGDALLSAHIIPQRCILPPDRLPRISLADQPIQEVILKVLFSLHILLPFLPSITLLYPICHPPHSLYTCYEKGVRGYNRGNFLKM
jgi:hypothetical protein